MAERKNSEARIKANNRYNEKAYDRINIAVPKGKKEVIQAHAAIYSESLNAFTNRAIDNQMERDNGNEIPYIENTTSTPMQLSAEEMAHIERRRQVLAQAQGLTTKE